MSNFKDLVKISIKNKTVFHSAMEYFFSKTDRTSGYLAEQSVKYDVYSKLKKKYSKYVGKTNFNLPAVSLKGIALISFLSKTTSFPKSLFKRRFAPYTPKRVAIKRS